MISEETKMADEPDLQAGDSGEWVTHLQQRLHELSLYDGPIDGTYGEATDFAVQRLHEAAGLQHDRAVSAQTWQAIAAQEELAGATQGQEDYAAGAPELAVGQLSEDGRWQWDGSDWQAAAVAEEPAEVSAGQLSDDGKWRWDGGQWQAVTEDQGGETQHGGEPAEGESHEIAVNEAADDPTTEEAALIG
jgi:peptidoglycan hydrolase-like protein with peptidoglycan-binding domain